MNRRLLISIVVLALSIILRPIHITALQSIGPPSGATQTSITEPKPSPPAPSPAVTGQGKQDISDSEKPKRQPDNQPASPKSPLDNPARPQPSAGPEQSKGDSNNDNSPFNWWWDSGPNIVIAVFTVVLAFVGIAQWIAMNKQAVYMKDGLQVTRQAADAAAQSANVAHDALVQTERPFVLVRDFPWLWHPDTGRPGKYWYSIHPTVENSGNTPTKDMSIVIQYALRDSPLPNGFDFPFTSEPGPTLIGPRGVITAATGTITDDDLRAVQNRTKYFYAWGIIEYHDTFDYTPLHTTKFCAYIGKVLGDPSDPTKPVEIHFMVYREHNSAD